MNFYNIAIRNAAWDASIMLSRVIKDYRKGKATVEDVRLATEQRRGIWSLWMEVSRG